MTLSQLYFKWANWFHHNFSILKLITNFRNLVLFHSSQTFAHNSNMCSSLSVPTIPALTTLITGNKLEASNPDPQSLFQFQYCCFSIQECPNVWATHPRLSLVLQELQLHQVPADQDHQCGECCAQIGQVCLHGHQDATRVPERFSLQLLNSNNHRLRI